jgi:hypothetical protein
MPDLEALISDNHKYKKAEKEELDGLVTEFIEACCATTLFDSEEARMGIGVDKKVMAKIVEQVRKRKLYFYVYHDIEPINNLNELKETALYVFWLLKLQPFFWRRENADSRHNFELNAKVALMFFLNGLALYAKNKTDRAQETCQSAVYRVALIENEQDILNKLYYSFRYRDWSKEALMDLAESLIICYKTK